MKKIRTLIVCIVCVLVLAAPLSTNAAGKISKKSLYLIKGQSYSLKVKGVSGKTKWKTSNSTIASVSAKGKVKAKKKGNVEIKAKIDGSTYICKVKVYNSYSNKKLCNMVKKYYKNHYKEKGWTLPKKYNVVVDNRSGNKALIHVYEIVNDSSTSGHTATMNWLNINVKTGMAEDFYGKKINLKKYAN